MQPLGYPVMANELISTVAVSMTLGAALVAGQRIPVLLNQQTRDLSGQDQIAYGFGRRLIRHRQISGGRSSG